MQILRPRMILACISVHAAHGLVAIRMPEYQPDFPAKSVLNSNAVQVCHLWRGCEPERLGTPSNAFVALPDLRSGSTCRKSWSRVKLPMKKAALMAVSRLQIAGRAFTASSLTEAVRYSKGVQVMLARPSVAAQRALWQRGSICVPLQT